MKRAICTILAFAIVCASGLILFEVWFVASMSTNDRPPAADTGCALQSGSVFELGRFPYFVRERSFWWPEGCRTEPAPVHEEVLLSGLFVSLLLSLAVLGIAGASIHALLRQPR
jgi:hypothetical protein